METIPNNFLGLPDKYSRYADARFVVLPIPYDSAASYQPGARNGPAAIMSSSYHLEWFDEELEAEMYKCGIATLEALEPNLTGPEAMQKDIFTYARRAVRDGKFVFGFGGDHSVTLGLYRAAKTKHKTLSILQIDAHLDLRDDFMGSPHAHACVMRRAVELGAHIVPVGIRAVSPEEHRFLKRKTAKQGRPITPITARDCHMQDDWVDRVLGDLGDNVYVTIDIDGFDPSFAPGTGTPEPGGLDWYQVTGLLRLVAAEKNIVGADIVEVIPLPGQVVTEFLAARLAYKLMAYIQAGA